MENRTIRKINRDGTISKLTCKEYHQRAEKFHGFLAPGLALGGFMVDLAIHSLPPGDLFDAISETRSCLPDAIQILTPCTVGNGWLKIMDFTRFALCLYNKVNGKGARVFVDPEKIKAWPHVRDWLYKLKTKQEQDYSLLMDEFVRAGSDFCTVETVLVKPEYFASNADSISKVCNCGSCGEPFKTRVGDIVCPACTKKGLYDAG